jgi:hypothetical protein
MAIRHRAYLLDSTAFQLEVAPIINILDQGNLYPLFNKAVSVFEQGSVEDWPLNSSGESLLDITKFNCSANPWEKQIEEILYEPENVHPSEIGYWLLIFFSQFLEECAGIGINYTILDGILDERGWSKRERSVIFEGTPTYRLIKPESDQIPPQKPSVWRYWHWMRPGNVFREGVISKEEIMRLYNHLDDEKECIRSFDHRQFGEEWRGWPLDVPEGQMEFLNRLQDAYSNTLTMFSEAIDAKKSLYVTLSYT